MGPDRRTTYISRAHNARARRVGETVGKEQLLMPHAPAELRCAQVVDACCSRHFGKGPSERRHTNLIGTLWTSGQRDASSLCLFIFFLFSLLFHGLHRRCCCETLYPTFGENIKKKGGIGIAIFLDEFK